MNLGKINYWFGRIISQGNRFVQPANFLMLIYLTSKDQPLVWLVVPMGIAFAGLWYWLDTKKVVEEELNYLFERNPFMREMRGDIKEIKEKMK